MENIKQGFSDLVHNWTIITMITLFMFSVNPAITPNAEAAGFKTAIQIKQEALLKFSTTKYSASDRLTDIELVKLLKYVGFSGTGLKKAWSIAKRESNGRPLAHNGNRRTGDNSYGIFQINMIGSLGPVRKDKYNLKSNKQLFNPVTNAEITYKMTKGGKDWSSWKGMNAPAQKWLKQYPTQKV